MPINLISADSFIDNLTYLRHRTGVIEIPTSEIPWADEIARKLELKTINWVEWKLNSLKDNGETNIRELTANSLRRDIEKIAEEGQYEKRLRAIISFDIALASQTNEDLINFWEWAVQNFRPQVGIVVFLPRSSEMIFPYTQRTKWIQCQRLLQINMEDTE